MLNDLTIFVNTHSSASDCWRMFFGQMQKHWSGHPEIVVACDVPESIDDTVLRRDYLGKLQFVDYSAAKKFSNQYLMGLCAVETPYVLPLQEDMLLYADVDEAVIRDACGVLNSIGRNAVSLIDSGRDLTYSMQASVWKTRSLRVLYSYIQAATPWDAEILGNGAMRGLDMDCRQRRDDHLPLRGRDHRDSPIFPYIATALVKGKWNSEYRVELEPLHREYGIDANIRGWSA